MTKPLARHQVLLFWMVLVICGCLASIVIAFSTISAHSGRNDKLTPTAVNFALACSRQTSKRSKVFAERSKHQSPRQLRILFYARYSTEEQDASSIADQFAYCRKQLARYGLEGVIEEIFDAEMSGELRHRPGIDEVRKGILERRWDVIMSEDSGRTFREESFAFDFVYHAVDKGLRVIFPNDRVDTHEDGWEDRLHDAQRQHSTANRYTRQRIARRMQSLWDRGAAIGRLRTGYLRKASHPATDREPAKGPHFDEVHSVLGPAVHEAFERISQNEAPWLVAKWLTENKVPKCGRSSFTDWNDRDIVALIRRTIYRGFDRHRVKIARKEYSTGKQMMEWAPEDQVWEREMPQLRIVSDDLWYRANAAIVARRRRPECVKGYAHPLHGIPRDSRSPLSNLFVCGQCGAKMAMEGRNEGGYRCSGARRHTCWNKATALKVKVHEAIGCAVVEQLLAPDAMLDTFIQFVSEVYADDSRRAAEEEKLSTREQKLVQKCERFGTAIGNGSGSSVTLSGLLEKAEAELACVRGDLKRLRNEMRVTQPMPTRVDIEESLRRMAGQLLEAKPESRVLLELLVDGKIRAVPYRQLGGNLIVLRAEFELRLAGILPAEIAHALRGRLGEDSVTPTRRIRISINLFEPSGVAANAVAAQRLKDKGLTLDKIGTELKISKRQAVSNRIGVSLTTHATLAVESRMLHG